MKHVAKKRFGQNFLTDASVIDALVQAIAPQAGDLMVEIGPGLGALTKPLLQKLNHLHVIEVDRDIIAWMQEEYASQSITVHHSDALKFDFASLNPNSTDSLSAAQLASLAAWRNIRVVGNLPYNISTPILFHLLENAPHIIDMHFMLQKEVVERMVAKPSSAAYGRLSVMLQYYLQMEYLFTVPPEAFDPAPKVESAFVRCVPYSHPPQMAIDVAMFARVVTAAFSQRRKTLRNTLKGILDDTGFAQSGINPQLRAENLGVADFVSIANYLSQHQIQI